MELGFGVGGREPGLVGGPEPAVDVLREELLSLASGKVTKTTGSPGERCIRVWKFLECQNIALEIMTKCYYLFNFKWPFKIRLVTVLRENIPRYLHRFIVSRYLKDSKEPMYLHDFKESRYLHCFKVPCFCTYIVLTNSCTYISLKNLRT